MRVERRGRAVKHGSIEDNKVARLGRHRARREPALCMARQTANQRTVASVGVQVEASGQELPGFHRIELGV